LPQPLWKTGSPWHTGKLALPHTLENWLPPQLWKTDCPFNSGKLALPPTLKNWPPLSTLENWLSPHARKLAAPQLWKTVCLLNSGKVAASLNAGKLARFLLVYTVIKMKKDEIIPVFN
jgi:hypothetical protein